MPSGILQTQKFEIEVFLQCGFNGFFVLEFPLLRCTWEVLSCGINIVLINMDYEPTSQVDIIEINPVNQQLCPNYDA